MQHLRLVVVQLLRKAEVISKLVKLSVKVRRLVYYTMDTYTTEYCAAHSSMWNRTYLQLLTHPSIKETVHAKKSKKNFVNATGYIYPWIHIDWQIHSRLYWVPCLPYLGPQKEWTFHSQRMLQFLVLQLCKTLNEIDGGGGWGWGKDTTKIVLRETKTFVHIAVIRNSKYKWVILT